MYHALRILFGEVNFTKLKNTCIQGGTLLPSEFIKAADKLEDPFDALDDPVYCNWLNTCLLKRIVKVINIPKAKHLIQAYEEYVYPRKLSDVRKPFHSNYFNPSHVSFVKAKIALCRSHTVYDIINYCRKLENGMGIYTGSVTATECQPSCSQITCVIPVHCALHAHKMAKTNFLKFRQSHIQYIEIEPFPKVFTLRFSFKESSLASGTSMHIAIYCS